MTVVVLGLSPRGVWILRRSLQLTATGLNTVAATLQAIQEYTQHVAAGRLPAGNG